MKNKSLLFAVPFFLLAIINNSISQEVTDYDIEWGHDLIYSGDIEGSYPTTAMDNIPFLKVTACEQLNVTGVTEAYPYLSADGMRLYYTISDSLTNLYMATRENMDSEFSSPISIGNNLPDGAFSAWLTNDELIMFYLDEDTHLLYRTERSSISEKFDAGIEINLNGVQEGFKSGPSLSGDLSTLYLYNGITVIICERDGENSYSYKNEITKPDGYKLHPGQISKDNLSYYTSMSEGEFMFLVKYVRPSVDEEFEDFVILEEPNYESKQSGSQPTVSGDESTLMYITSPSGRWEDDDLLMAKMKITKPLAREFNERSLSVYPNPFSSEVNIDLEHLAEGEIQIHVLDSKGKEVFSQKKIYAEGEITENLDLSKLKEGMYTIIIESLNSSTSTRVIKTLNN